MAVVAAEGMATMTAAAGVAAGGAASEVVVVVTAVPVVAVGATEVADNIT